jgi:enoyl-CoA hydratase/carnithine racemase
MDILVFSIYSILAIIFGVIVMKLVSVEWHGETAQLVLNHAPLNLWTTEFMEQLSIAAEAIHDKRNSLRGLLVRSTTEHFSGGVNVGEAFAGRNVAAGREILKRHMPSIHLIEQLPFPTIAAVSGYCLAGGLELALACDLIVAADDAVLGQSEALIGTATLLNGAARLAQRVGVARAKEAVFFAQFRSAKDWYDWGVVNKLVPRDQLESVAIEWLKVLAAGPTRAHAMTKGMLHAYENGGIAQSDAWLITHAPELFESRDMQNGVKTLVENGAKKIRELGRFENA